MIGIIVATHGGFAEGIVDAVKMIIGQNLEVIPLGLSPSESIDDYRQRMINAVKFVDHGSGVAILVDLFGASPMNVAATLFQLKYPVEILTGVNLPVLITACMKQENTSSAKKLIEEVVLETLDSVQNVSKIFRERM